MEPTVKKESAEKIPFLKRSIVRTILPIAGFVIICVLFAILTDGKLFKPKNISLLLSQSYMLLISSIGVFMVMTMGGLDFSQGSMLGVCSIVVCYLSHYNIIGCHRRCSDRRTDRSDERIFQRKAQDHELYRNDLQHVPVPRSLRICDDQFTGLWCQRYLKI